MRFDDSLETVLSGDMSSPIGAELAWRQLVDLVGRGRVAPTDHIISRLRAIRAAVPPPVRTASARAVADASPPLSLVTLFAEDEIAIAAPVLRSVRLASSDWAELLPRLSPTGRSILRHRRDLPNEVLAMLASFGSVDFVLAAPVQAERTNDVPASCLAEEPFTSSLDPEARDDVSVPTEVVPQGQGARNFAADAKEDRGSKEPYEIAEMLKRIAAYQRSRATFLPHRNGPSHDVREDSPSDRFQFETDSSGAIRWVEGVSRTALVGLSLAHAIVGDEVSGVDAAVAEAFRQRSTFTDLGLVVAGQSDAAGLWRITAVPLFDRSTGRFDGFRGNACRPTSDDLPERPVPNAAAVADALRQLVHELRTPTNAIAGFAEMIETEMLGPVPDIYRGQAVEIRSQTADLLVAIEEMDTAARLEADTGQRETGQADVGQEDVGQEDVGQGDVDDVSLSDMLDRIATDLAPLATLRGATIALHGLDDGFGISGDGRAIERLIGRLLATLVSATCAREQIGVVVSKVSATRIRLVFDRPCGLASDTDDPDWDSETPALGTGFALRLTGNLAVELGGELQIGRNALTLELPTGHSRRIDRGSSN